MEESILACGVDLRGSQPTGDNIAGIGVHIASRVMDQAPNGGIAVSSTVRAIGPT